MWFVVMVLVWAIDGFCVGVVAVGRGSLLLNCNKLFYIYENALNHVGKAWKHFSII